MKAFDVHVEQDEPEYLSETVVVFAGDIMDAIVIGLDLVSALKEEVIKLGSKPSDVANLRVESIGECGVIINQMPTETKIDKDQLGIFAKVLHAQLGD